MPVNSRLNKAGLSTLQKNQVRRALNEKVAIQVAASDITSQATLGTTLADVRAAGTGNPYFSFPVKAYKTYLVTAQLFVTHTDNNGSKIGFTGPTAGMLYGLVRGPLVSSNLALYDGFDDVSTEAAGGGGTTNYAIFNFTYRPTADGYLKAQWAESTSHANTIIVEAGSFVKVEEVA